MTSSGFAAVIAGLTVTWVLVAACEWGMVTYDLTLQNNLPVEISTSVEVRDGYSPIEVLAPGETFTYPDLVSDRNNRYVAMDKQGALLAERCYTRAQLEAIDWLIVFDAKPVEVGEPGYCRD
jgi:hypothetical protein